MEIIKSLQNQKVKELSKLNQKKYREQEGKFLVCGEHLVEEACKSGYLREVWQTEDYQKNFDVPTMYVSYEVLKKISNLETPQQVIGVCQKKKEGLIGKHLLLIDDLQDPGNLGTILRSAVAFNVDTVVLSPNCVDLYNDKVIRASEGMLFHLNIIKRDLKEFILKLRDEQYVILGTKVDGGTDLEQIVKSDKMAFIVGNEGAGVKTELLEECDDYLYIPMNKNCESLNVGVATGIILYSLFSK